MHRIACLLYFGASAVLALGMPTSVLIVAYGSEIHNEIIVSIGYQLLYICSFLSLSWNILALIATLNLARPNESANSLLNRAAATALAHCGYYALLIGLGCVPHYLTLKNSLDVSHLCLLFVSNVFSMIYLVALGTANVYQLIQFWRIKNGFQQSAEA